MIGPSQIFTCARKIFTSRPACRGRTLWLVLEEVEVAFATGDSLIHDSSELFVSMVRTYGVAYTAAAVTSSSLQCTRHLCGSLVGYFLGVEYMTVATLEEKATERKGVRTAWLPFAILTICLAHFARP